MRLGGRYRLGNRISGGFRRAQNIVNKAIDVLKRAGQRIYIWFILGQFKRKLVRLQSSRLECFRHMGERIYELKKDSSFELIDVAAVNEYMDNLREINNKIKELKVKTKEVQGGKIEGLSSWWSRRGSNP